MDANTTPEWATHSQAYRTYQDAARRCATAFGPRPAFRTWTSSTGERRRYITNVDQIVFPAARNAYNGSLSNSQCDRIRLMIMQAEPYVTDQGGVRGGSIIYSLDRFDATDFREAVKAAVAAHTNR